MSKQFRTVAIRGAYGLGNFGDDALMYAACTIAEDVFKPKCIVFLCRASGYIHGIVPEARVVESASECPGVVDIVLYGGGTQFYSFPLTARTSAMVSARKCRRVVEHPVFAMKTAYRKIRGLCGRGQRPRIVALGIGVGPFEIKCPEMVNTQSVFRGMDYIFVRDVDSFELCKRWGCANVTLGADLCYFPGLWDVQSGSVSDCCGVNSVRRIGVIPRDWPHTEKGNAYVQPLLHVVQQLRLAGREVEYVFFSQRSEQEWAKRLRDRNEVATTWVPDTSTLSDFLRMLSRYDVLITARYHGAVFASLLGKPVVCIDVEEKLRLVSELLLKGARLWTFPFEPKQCLCDVQRIEETYGDAVACLNGVVSEQRKLLKRCIDELRCVMQE